MIYEGQFNNDKFFGIGKQFFDNKKIKYEGYFKDGLFHGSGKLYDENSG